MEQGKWVKRTPSTIYWSGIRQYGIFKGGNISLTEYVRAMCSQKNSKETLKKLGNRNDNAEENECDDLNAGDIFKIQFWNLPIYTKNWFENLTIGLTKEEGAFLKRQIIKCFPNSMLAYILKNNMREVLEIDSYQELETIIKKFPKEMQEDYYRALKFSDFMYVIRTVYNIIISDGKNVNANNEFEKLKPRFNEIALIDLNDIIEKLGINNTNLSYFLENAKGCILQDNIENLKKVIKSREFNMKKQRAKTLHPGEYKPDSWIGGKELDYRFRYAKVIIRDIFESEVDVDA